MSIVVTGSIAFDNIMDFPGAFKDHILPDKVHMLSVSFLVDSLKKQRGGAAANAAYNLTLLGEQPTLLAAVGGDFAAYATELEACGVDLSPVRVYEDEFTACAFITTDRHDNQITGFYPGAMRHASELSLHDVEGEIDLVVITPDAPDAMAKYPQECRNLGIPYVYSPAQQIVSLEGEVLTDGIRGARCVIGNDYEMQLIADKTGSDVDGLLDLAEMVITTRGESGSVITTKAGAVEIPVAPASQIVDPTGAGDAYVAGIARGLVRDEAPEVFGRVAALTAVHVVENYGTQAHTFDDEAFQARYREAFGS